jgi:hypothetical protein
MLKLEEYADVTVGQIMTRVTENSEAEQNIVKVLNPKAINAGCIDEDAITEANVVKKIDNSKFTRVGDIVVKLSTPYEGVLIDSKHEGLLVSSFCAIIRLNGNRGISKDFLCAVLNSDYAREQIQKKVAGTNNPMVKITDLRSILLPNVSEEDMKLLGEEYRLSCRKRFLLNKLEEGERALMNARLMNCLHKENTNDGEI